ncbi:MAG: MFS transporter, partial [Chloroflexi bacterium]|nr:MFS transporter [Chloroflexota bacterium]
MLPRFLQPTPTLTDEQVSRSLMLMKWEGVLSGVMFSLGTGGFMAAYALALGANNFQIGILASLPFISQVLQIPGAVLVERYRSRKAINVVLWVFAQSMWVPIGLVPFLVDTPGSLAISLVILFLGIRGIFAPIVSIAWNSWMHDLVPQSILGSYYARRSALVTGVTAVATVAAGYLIDLWQRQSSDQADVYGFSFVFVAGALFFGLSSSVILSKCSEPQMRPAVPTGQSTIRALMEPWHDHNFKHLIKFLFVWSFSSNLAIPFFAVYMLTRLDMSLTAVVLLTAVGYAANVWFVGAWGNLADKAGNKTVLSLSASLYLLVFVGWTFTTFPERHAFTLPLLVVLHIFAGFAAGGTTVTAGTIALKMAPRDNATPYLALAAVATFLGQGLGPLVGGALADFSSGRSFTISAEWVSPQGANELPALSLTGFDLLFALAFVLSLLSLNLLIALREEGEVPRDAALKALSQSSAAAMAKINSWLPGLSILAGPSYGHLRKIPGLDVAMGVTAYQVAASTAAAVRVGTRGRFLVRNVSREVTQAIEQMLEQLGDLPEQGLELARHAMRGAVGEAGESTVATHGAVVGTLQTLSATEASSEEILEGVGYGAVEGALEGDADPGEVAIEVVAGAREVAEALGMDPEAA